MIKDFLIFVFTSLLLLIGLDIYFRVSEIQTPHFSMIDSERGKINIPDRNVLFISEGFYMGKTNELGYWGPSYSYEKEGNAFRIAVIGNSFVEGIQLFDRYHFRRVLEDNLNHELDVNVEVLNFGKGRNNLSDMFYSYNYFIKDFNPDLVLFFIDYTSVELDMEQSLADMAPVYYLEKGNLQIDYSFRDSKSFQIIQAAEFFLKHSTLTRLLYNSYQIHIYGRTPLVVFGKFAELTRSEQLQNDHLIEFPELNELSQSIIKEIIQSDENIIVFNPRDNTELSNELHYLIPDNQLIDLSIPFDTLSMESINPYYWQVTNRYGHWNHTGHKYVGDFLSNVILDHITINKDIELE